MSRQHAFSLVELAIVLVILGLLVGGILAGQALIRASEIRTVIGEADKQVTAINAFRDKYFGVPGDLKNATRIWGHNASACADVATTAGSPGTCNGNGNGYWEVAAVTAGASSEHLQMWNQMSMAGLVEGSYTGVYDTGATVSYDGPLPQSKLGGMFWDSYYRNAVGDAEMYAVDYGNAMEIRGIGTASPLRPEEAWNIDTKVDDTRPSRGRIIARYWDGVCAEADTGVTSNTNFDASYRLMEPEKVCNLIYRRLM